MSSVTYSLHLLLLVGTEVAIGFEGGNIKVKGQNPVVADFHAFIDALENSCGLEKNAGSWKFQNAIY